MTGHEHVVAMHVGAALFGPLAFATARFRRAVAWRMQALRDYRSRVLEVLWNSFGRPVQTTRIARTIGESLHRRACRVQDREATADYTRFFRNLPQLKALRDHVLEMPRSARLNLAVVGCSSGAELYSALWMIKTSRPDLRVRATGIDISLSCIEQAAAGVYPGASRAVEGITENTYEGLFRAQGTELRVCDWLRDGVTWEVANACSPALLDELGLQDVVLVNNVLCHMPVEEAERCLRNLSALVVPMGLLFVWGVDLPVKVRVLRDLHFSPLTTRFADIHRADDEARQAWPLRYWGIEPLDTTRPDWAMRYAAVYRRAEVAEVAA